jgi:hypothetical protein
MSQSNVERVIGRLLTDEGFRRRFGRDPTQTLAECVEAGCELNPCEQRALAALDPGLLTRLADSIDPRLQKIDSQGVAPCDA